MSRKEFLAKRTLFIPELVELEPVPGSLWREIQMLPFVIERISAFIKIGEFRQSIDDETTLGLVQNEEEQGRTSTDLPQKLFYHLVIIFLSYLLCKKSYERQQGGGGATAMSASL